MFEMELLTRSAAVTKMACGPAEDDDFGDDCRPDWTNDPDDWGVDCMPDCHPEENGF